MECFSSAKYIQAIADARNISAAAEKLGISQPALSVQLKKLETLLGEVLFDRSKQPLELTDAGEVYLRYAEKYQALHKAFAQELTDLGELKTGKLTVGGAASFNTSYFPRAIAEFAERYPGIDFEIVDGNIPEITTKALNGQIDLFVTAKRKLDERLRYEELFQERIFLCVPPDRAVNEGLQRWRLETEDVLAGRWSMQAKEIPEADFTSFREEPFILLKEEQHIGQIMESLFVKYGFRPKKVILAEQTMTSYSLTLAGAGISLMTESTLRNSNFKEYPALYMVDRGICARRMYAAYAAQKYLSKAAKAFIAILQDALKA